MRVRARLLFLIGAALLPAVAVQANFEREALAARAAEDRIEAMRLVRLVATDLDSVVDGARQLLTAVGNLEAVTSGSPEGCTPTLSQLLKDIPRYTSIALVDAAGRVVCSGPLAQQGQDLADRAFFRLARATGRFSVGERVASPVTGVDVLYFALPLADPTPGRGGMVVAGLDLGWLNRRLAALPLPVGGSAIVVDRAGTILARAPDPERFIGQQATDSFRHELSGDGFTVREGTGVDGVNRIYAAGHLGVAPEGLFVGIGIDPASGEAALAALRQRGLLVIAAGGLAALALAAFVAYRFVERPMEALLETMERWRAGDAEARAANDPRLGRRGDGEFTRIAAAFDQAAEAVEARSAALRESEARFHQIAAAVDDALLVVEPGRQRAIYASPAFERLTGSSSQPYVALGRAVHPEDWPQLAALLGQPAEQPFDTEYRIRRADGSERRMRHRRFPVRDSATGRAVAVISDVTEERAAAERQVLLVREVDHRAKNVLAVVQSILRLTRAESPRAFASAVEGRVAALARAHQLLARNRWGGADLLELLREECAPYGGGVPGDAPAEGSAAVPCVLQGPALRLGPDGTQAIAMVVHELATNSAKHGALSRPGGVVRIAWALEVRGPEGAPWLDLHWTESGGPPVQGTPQRLGFGSRVIATTVERQMGGEVQFDWAVEGLRCRLSMPAARLLQPIPPEEPGRPGHAVALSGRHRVEGDAPVDAAAVLLDEAAG